MELREYWRMFRKWWWLLALVGAMFNIGAFVISMNMTPTYESSTLLIVGGSIDVVNPTSGELQTSEKLAATYAELVKTDAILTAAGHELGLTEEPTVTSSLLAGTQLLRITVADSNPVRAAATADELARQLILQTPSGNEQQSLMYQEFVNQQLANVQKEIQDLDIAIITASEQGAGVDEISRLQTELNERRTTYSSLLSYLADASPNSIRVFEPAVVPTNPVKPKVTQNVILATVVGLMLAAGIAFLIDYLDDSIKTGEEIEQGFQIPVLGRVADIESEDGKPELVVRDKLLSQSAEEFRLLNTSIRYLLPSDEATRVFLLSSALAAEGKSLTVANLGSVAALAGQRVIIVDADMRRPRQATIFDVSAQAGLSSYLVGEVSSITDVLYDTGIKGLDLLPCGTVPPNPAELLASPRMDRLLEELESKYDLVLLDMPPLLAVSDASIVASRVSGVVIVVEARRTPLQAFSAALDLLIRAEGKPLGVVMNRAHQQGKKGYGYGHYGTKYGGYGYGYGHHPVYSAEAGGDVSLEAKTKD